MVKPQPTVQVSSEIRRIGTGSKKIIQITEWSSDSNKLVIDQGSIYDVPSRIISAKTTLSDISEICVSIDLVHNIYCT